MSILAGSGESEPEPEPPRRRALWIASALGLLGIMAAATWFFLRAPDDGTAKSTDATKRAPVASAKSAARDLPRNEKEKDGSVREVGAKGALEVTSNVDGARVMLDGEAAGVTPFESTSLPPSRYEVLVEAEGHPPFQRSIEVKAGRRARLHATFSPSAVLRIESDVSGASVFIDRRYVGTTPVEARDLEPGPHQITVSAEGYDMYAETVETSTSPRDVMVRFKEVKLSEAVQVVHKHRLGSCTGRLIATPQGLRYDTSDKDRFAVALAAMDGLEVDYMTKNLKVKLKGGRTYNFTEPSGNADALYVFQQKVAAVSGR